MAISVKKRKNQTDKVFNVLFRKTERKKNVIDILQ